MRRLLHKALAFHGPRTRGPTPTIPIASGAAFAFFVSNLDGRQQRPQRCQSATNPKAEPGGKFSAWSHLASERNILPPVALWDEVTDRKGKNIHLHSTRVLDSSPRFSGAVWAPLSPNGVVMFHGSVFSNWYETQPGQFKIVHEGKDFSFTNSEGPIMAVKERIGTGIPLKDCLAKHSILGPSDSKQAAVAAGDAYPLWGDHTFQVLLTAAVCLHKFSQDSELRKALMDTGKSVLLECAPNDGSFGVAKDSASFLEAGERAEHYTLQSIENSELHFSTGTWSGQRQRREANALGKALMIVRSCLQRTEGVGSTIEPTLCSALKLVLDEVQLIPDVSLVDVQKRVVDLERLFECYGPSSV